MMCVPCLLVAFSAAWQEMDRHGGVCTGGGADAVELPAGAAAGVAADAALPAGVAAEVAADGNVVMLAVARLCEDHGAVWLSRQLAPHMEEVRDGLTAYEAKHGHNSLASIGVIQELAQAGSECLRVWPDAGPPSHYQQVCSDRGSQAQRGPVVRVVPPSGSSLLRLGGSIALMALCHAWHHVQCMSKQ